MRRFLPAAIWVCVATAAGALLGAPIGAWVVKESIVDKMYKTAVAAGIGSVVAEIIGPISKRFGDPSSGIAKPTPSDRELKVWVLRPDVQDAGGHLVQQISPARQVVGTNHPVRCG